METPIKMDDLGGPLFSETSICSYQTRFVKTTCSFDFGDIMTFSTRTRTLAHTHTHTHTLTKTKASSAEVMKEDVPFD